MLLEQLLYAGVKVKSLSACGAFFSQAELSTFHRFLTPLSSRSIVESCAMLVLMYASGTNVSLLLKLESFQTEIGKRILKLPRFTANNVPLMAIGWHSMRCRCLSAPYYRVSSRNVDTLSSEVYRTLSMPDVESVSL